MAFRISGAAIRNPIPPLVLFAVLTLVLAGVVVGAFAAALVSLATFFADPETKLPGIVFWLMGSFAASDWLKVSTVALCALPPAAVLLGMRWRINVLSLGDEDAAALGVRVRRDRLVVLTSVCLIVAAQVAVSGVNLGWIRLVSSDAEVQIDRSYLTANIGGRYPAFSARSGGQLPVIDTLFSMMSTGAAAGRDGIFVFDGGAVTVGSGKGVKAAGGNGIGAATDIVVQKGATINAVEATGGTSVTPNTVSANGIIFK